jgi:hypothetical protein
MDLLKDNTQPWYQHVISKTPRPTIINSLQSPHDNKRSTLPGPQHDPQESLLESENEHEDLSDMDRNTPLLAPRQSIDLDSILKKS